MRAKSKVQSLKSKVRHSGNGHPIKSWLRRLLIWVQRCPSVVVLSGIGGSGKLGFPVWEATLPTKGVTTVMKTGLQTTRREGERPRMPKHPQQSGLAETLALPEGRISARAIVGSQRATRAVANKHNNKRKVSNI